MLGYMEVLVLFLISGHIHWLQGVPPGSVSGIIFGHGWWPYEVLEIEPGLTESKPSALTTVLNGEMIRIYSWLCIQKSIMMVFRVLCVVSGN